MPPHITWLVSGSENAYGVGRATESLMKAITQIEFSVSTIALADGPIVDRCRAYGEVIVGPNIVVPGFAGDGLTQKLASVLRRQSTISEATKFTQRAASTLNPDVIHVQWPSLLYVAANAARKTGARCTWEIPNTISRGQLMLNRAYYQWLCMKHRIIPLANSAHTSSSLGHWPVRSQVFHLGADDQIFNPQSVIPIDRTLWNASPTTAVIVVAASVSPEKGQRSLARAVLDRLEAGEDWRLVIVGGPLNGEEANAIRYEAEQHRFGKHIHLVGPTNSVESYFASCDISANVRRSAEPFGLSVIEAMMMERPVLVHASGGPAETVLDGQTGWHMPSIAHADLVAGLSRAYKDRHEWKAMGINARNHAMNRFTYQNVAARYRKVLIDAGIVKNTPLQHDNLETDETKFAQIYLEAHEPKP